VWVGGGHPTTPGCVRAGRWGLAGGCGVAWGTRDNASTTKFGKAHESGRFVQKFGSHPPLEGCMSSSRSLTLYLVLLFSSAHALRIPSFRNPSARTSRRAVLAAPLVSAIGGYYPNTAAAVEPTNWGLVPELDQNAPSANYLSNAEKFAEHLEWAATLKPGVVDSDAGGQLKAEIQEFAALYRKDKYTSYGLMPGFTSLQTAYDALSAHNQRYGPCKVALPEQLTGTILRNVKDARRQILVARRKAGAEAAAQ
jgi:hypothetical protein